jgi:hypothetical protein
MHQPAAPARSPRSPRARFRRAAWWVASGVATVIAAGCTAATPPVFPPATPAAGPSAAPRSVTAARAGRQRAELHVLSGATSITVDSAPLGGDLIRATVPAGAGLRPDLVVSGATVQLFLDSTGTGGPAAVRVTLNSAVAWRLGFSGGFTLTSVFLGRGRLRGADFTAGSSQITMRLPRPSGTVAIVLAGGASQVALAAPRGVPARLRLAGGAGRAVLDGQVHTGIAGGTVLAAPSWAAAANRYDIVAPAGIAAISVGTW